MTASMTFDDLVAEGAAVPVEGWDFSWFAGRATEERPSWGYSRLLGEAMARVDAALDIQTGGGEVLAGIPKAPPVLAATESWLPNLEVARRNLAPLGATVVESAEDAPLPFADASFNLVCSRHPTITPWAEIARVLRPGGNYLSQAIGAGTVRELTDYMMGPQPVDQVPTPQRVRVACAEVGLVPDDVRQESLRMEFFDIAAVVHFLRKVIWIVPGFTVDAYHDRLLTLHQQIQAEGPFVAHSQRVLVVAHKPTAHKPTAHKLTAHKPV